jgi:hypothetical protein
MEKEITVEVKIEYEGEYCSSDCNSLKFDDWYVSMCCDLFNKNLEITDTSLSLRCDQCIEATKEK